MEWVYSRAWTIACVWNIKNNHHGRYKAGQYKEFEEDLYSMFGEFEEEIIDIARKHYYEIQDKYN